MSSFFTTPATKRKRPQGTAKLARKSDAPSKQREEQADEISSGDEDEDAAGAGRDEEYEGVTDEEEEYGDEDPAAKRIRLAEQYLANTQKEVLQDVGFDAADVDKENLRRRMGERLKEDTAESRGKLYRWIAEDLDWSRSVQKTQRMDGHSATGVAVSGQYAYTVQRDAISRWELPISHADTIDGKQMGRKRKQPKRVAYTRGNPKKRKDRDYQHHVAPILCIAASQDGKFVATGGADNRLIAWDAATLRPLKVFYQHRDSVTALAFRRGTNQIFSASKDRTVKIWSLDELAYIETLFGHQDEVVDVSALAQEKCVTVGARDRTARLWKVVEESQLVFRGGGAPSKPRKGKDVPDDSATDPVFQQKPYNEGSMDRVACIDDETFITGSDNGSLSLWNIHKKKPVFTYPLAHGLDPPPTAEELSAEEKPDPEVVAREPQPRWVTALTAIPFSDTFVSGSWDGYVRAWRVSQDKRRIEAIGPVGRAEQESSRRTFGDNDEPMVNGDLEAAAARGLVRGVVNDLSIIDRGDRGREGVLVAAAVGKEHRLGRWKEFKEGKASIVLFEVLRKSTAPDIDEREPQVNGGALQNGLGDEGFDGFDYFGEIATLPCFIRPIPPYGINMKRKRAPNGADRCTSKRVRHDADAELHLAAPLLRQYYPNVTTLRQYLASRLSKTSRKRRKRLLRSSSQGSQKSEPGLDALAKLLDTTLVGAFNHVSEAVDETIDRDITIFTQQISDSTTDISALKQSEIVDFVIWLLFRRTPANRRPTHILCHGLSRTSTVGNGDELETIPNIPGVATAGRNEHIDTLKGPQWSSLPAVVGSGAERVLSNMLFHCGIFVPLQDSSNLNQISGVPMSELKTLQRSSDHHTEQEAESPAARSPSNSAAMQRGLSNIRFVRHRMLYARPTLTSKGRPHFGLGHGHALNRLRDKSDPSETVHITKYIFPKQFELHNVFTSKVDPKDTAQPFMDYNNREYEIHRLEKRYQAKHGGELVSSFRSKPSHLPRRLRGRIFELLRRLRHGQQRCPYHALLQHHCPLRSRKGSTAMASSATEVSAYCRAVLKELLPSELLGTGEVMLHNRRHIMASADRFVRLRRYESMSMHDVLQPMKIQGIPWLLVPGTEGHNISRTDFAKRRELLAELVYYVFDSLLIPLIRGCFHVTESNIHRNQLFYFRHDIWRMISEPALMTLKTDMLEECSIAVVKKKIATRTLGVSQVRLLPKEQGMRPIINLRRRVQRMQRGGMALGRSINSILTPAFSILNYERTVRPELLGSAMFSVDDIFPRLQMFRSRLQIDQRGDAPLYFAKVDVQACFDTIPQQRLMALARTVLSANNYRTFRYARAKLLGGHSQDTSGFGAKPSWKFVTKATSHAHPLDFEDEIRQDTAHGRTRTAFVHGAATRIEKRKAIIDLLEEHIESNIIKVGRRFYRQRRGIPQGSIVSSLLCSYMYAELERQVLGFLDNQHTVLLRLIDDFLVITTDIGIAQQFMRVMHAGVPDFGVHVKAEKSRSNFDLTINGRAMTRLPSISDFPYCGIAINTATLELSKDQERRRKTNIADSITVEFSKIPGQSFYRKTLHALKLQMHAMLLSTAYNSLATVLSNLYHVFVEVALKAYHYIRSLPSRKQPGDELMCKAIDDLTKLAFVLMKRRKRSSKDILPYECRISNAQTRW
ncbi:Telomerase ribonucleoprotein complex - RNA binding domain [Teratosphaeria destructans]|uniref:Telomerase reverse transcriptase n=1 Tax=Teratosphaeria destructans TaxID=418781 RepID=A0A9W7SZW4_9PEZI|nr:Telomerase ribonucleoprotein complex - RNA binding domain [Teratosphaeria destructans]